VGSNARREAPSILRTTVPSCQLQIFT
jgi:hypothetical protein